MVSPGERGDAGPLLPIVLIQRDGEVLIQLGPLERRLGTAEIADAQDVGQGKVAARPAQLVATLLSRDEVAAKRAQGTLAPLFSISAMEFRVGLFPDIERAMASPGTEVRYGGPYLRHSEFKTSDAINAAIAAGTDEFFVDTDRGVARLQLVPPREPTR